MIHDKHIVFLVLGLIGMLAHCLKKIARGELNGNVVTYFFVDHPKNTLSALLAWAAASATVLATGSLNTMDIWMACSTGFMAGYTIDSAINKGL